MPSRRSARTWSIVIRRDRRGPRGQGRLEALAGDVAGVAVAAVDDVAQLGLVEGGVEVAGQDPGRAVAGRRQALQRLFPVRSWPLGGSDGRRRSGRDRRGVAPPRHAESSGARHAEASVRARSSAVTSAGEAGAAGVGGHRAASVSGAGGVDRRRGQLAREARRQLLDAEQVRAEGGRPGRPGRRGRRCHGGRWPRARSSVSGRAGVAGFAADRPRQDRGREAERRQRGNRGGGPVAQRRPRRRRRAARRPRRRA